MASYNQFKYYIVSWERDDVLFGNPEGYNKLDEARKVCKAQGCTPGDPTIVKGNLPKAFVGKWDALLAYGQGAWRCVYNPRFPFTAPVPKDKRDSRSLIEAVRKELKAQELRGDVWAVRDGVKLKVVCHFSAVEKTIARNNVLAVLHRVDPGDAVIAVAEERGTVYPSMIGYLKLKEVPNEAKD